MCTGAEPAAATTAKTATDVAAASAGDLYGTSAVAGTASLGTAAGSASEAALMAADTAQFGTAEAPVSVGGAVGSGITLKTLKDVATVLTPVASIVQTASGIQASRRLGATGAAPAVEPVAGMPIAGAGTFGQTVRNSLIDQLNRRGRAATILTAPSGEKLGS